MYSSLSSAKVFSREDAEKNEPGISRDSNPGSFNLKPNAIFGPTEISPWESKHNKGFVDLVTDIKFVKSTVGMPCTKDMMLFAPKTKLI